MAVGILIVTPGSSYGNNRPAVPTRVFDTFPTVFPKNDGTLVVMSANVAPPSLAPQCVLDSVLLGAGSRSSAVSVIPAEAIVSSPKFGSRDSLLLFP